ncbi:uncharacterized protein LOC144645469 isoform X1 [Oculina patagonica]
MVRGKTLFVWGILVVFLVLGLTSAKKGKPKDGRIQTPGRYNLFDKFRVSFPGKREATKLGAAAKRGTEDFIWQTPGNYWGTFVDDLKNNSSSNNNNNNNGKGTGDTAATTTTENNNNNEDGMGNGGGDRRKGNGAGDRRKGNEGGRKKGGKSYGDGDRRKHDSKRDTKKEVIGSYHKDISDY